MAKLKEIMIIERKNTLFNYLSLDISLNLLCHYIQPVKHTISQKVPIKMLQYLEEN